MSIDLILRANTKADMLRWALAHPLSEDYVETPAVIDPEDGVTVITPEVIGRRLRKGLEWSWWNGTGKLQTAKGTVEEDGTQITAPKYAKGFVLLLRIHSEAFRQDKGELDEGEEDTGDQLQRSKIARWVRRNGTKSTVAGINQWTIDGVKLYRSEDVYAFCQSRGVPAHTFL